MAQRGGIIHLTQRFWRWSSEYPNLRLAAFALATPVATMCLLISFEAIMRATVGRTLSERDPALGVCLLLLVLSIYTPLLVVPFALWRAERDRRKRTRLATHPEPVKPAESKGTTEPESK
jgi:hypothetical protein